MNTIDQPKKRIGGVPFAGYYKTDVPAPDAELTSTNPKTPLGEYMRRFWQPICMTEQLGDVPLAIRILGEDLVVFKDKGGQIALMHRQCCHRGASLEYGIIQSKGILCAYHGFHFDCDGTILSAPGEFDKGARLRHKLSQGAYPTFERDGLVFAYMGPPETVPPFPEYDAFEKYGNTELVPFSNVFPCNWMQVIDNIADQMHTSFLHNPNFLYSGAIPEGIEWERLALNYFASVPVMDYVEVRGGSGMVFIAGRRCSDDLVWIRINDLIVPNVSQHASLFETGEERRLFHRVAMSRWYVPVDDEHSIIYGWRMFGDEIDPNQKGDKSRVGWDKMDFLDGQVGDRSYEEGQRMPGDWEIITSQRKIAVHALENPLESDIGVYMFRKLVRNAINYKNSYATPDAMHERSKAGLTNYCYTQNDVLRIAKRGSDEEDRALIKAIGRKIVEVSAAADGLDLESRKRFMIESLEEIERTSATMKVYES